MVKKKLKQEFLKQPGLYLSLVLLTVFFLGSHESSLNQGLEEYQALCTNSNPDIYQLSLEEGILLLNQKPVLRPVKKNSEITGFVSILSEPRGQTTVVDKGTRYYLITSNTCDYELIISKNTKKQYWVKKIK